MKGKPKKFRLFNYSNRFLIGLIIALASVHLAFKWESERIEYKSPDIEDSYPTIDDDEILIPVTFPKVPERPEPKNNSNEIEVVTEFIRPDNSSPDENEDPFDPKDYVVDPDAYGKEELGAEVHPEPILSSQFPHTNACEGLINRESESCSRSELVRMIRDRMATPSILRDIGEKQGVQIEFTVSKEGMISDIKVLQQTHSALAREAEKAIKKLPKLNPATQNGLPVSMRMKVPIVLDFRK